MAKGFSTRSVAHVAWLAAAILLLSAGIALAASGGGKFDGGKRSAKHARLGDARALVGRNRCVARRSSRANTASVRRRCNRKPAVASGAAQPLYWGATIGSHLTGDQAPWDMNAVTQFEGGAGKSASMIQFFQPFAQCGGSGC